MISVFVYMIFYFIYEKPAAICAAGFYANTAYNGQ